MGKACWSALGTTFAVFLVAGAHRITQDGPVDIAPGEQAMETAYIDDIIDGAQPPKNDTAEAEKAKAEKAIPMFTVRNHPENGVMSVGTSYIVNQKSSNTFTESMRNKTSFSPHFLTKSCNKFDHCFQSFDHLSPEGEMFCDGPPAAQDGIGLGTWNIVESREIGCNDKPSDPEFQQCLIWDEYFIKVDDAGDTFFKWESMPNGTSRTTVIPPIKVAEVGKCFSKCSILHHPTVLQIAEPKFNRVDEQRMAQVFEFGQSAGCYCCDFQLFMPAGHSCRSYELDPVLMTWQHSHTMAGQVWDQGPECTEFYQKLNPAIPFPDGLSPAPINPSGTGAVKDGTVTPYTERHADAVLVDDAPTSNLPPGAAPVPNNPPDDMKDIDPASEVDKNLQISGPSAPAAPVPPPENQNVEEWAAPSVPFKRDPLSNRPQGAERTTLDRELHAAEHDPNEVKVPLSDGVRREIRRIQMWDAHEDDLPSVRQALGSYHTSLKKEISEARMYMKPDPQPREPPPEKKKTGREEAQEMKKRSRRRPKRGSLYIPKPASVEEIAGIGNYSSNVTDGGADDKAALLLHDIESTLEDEDRRREFNQKHLQQPTPMV